MIGLRNDPAVLGLQHLGRLRRTRRREPAPPEDSATFYEVGDGLAAASEKITDESLRRTFLEAAERYLTAQSIKL